VAPPCVIGVDLGGTKVLAGAVDDTLGVHHRSRREVAGSADGAAVLATVLATIGDVRAQLDAPVAAVGIGMPSLIDQRTGVAVTTVHLPLRDVPAADVLSGRLGVPVVVDNDGNCAAAAEARFGAGRGARRMLMIAVGTGIGGALVFDGRVERGALGAAGEIGHMVIDREGLPCHGNCPNRGCLETVCSGTALGREARVLAAEHPESALGRAARAGRDIDGVLVTQLAREGDAVAREAVTRIGTALGVGLSNVVNLFNPDVVVVGGGVIANGELLLAPARREMLARALSPSREHVRVVAARFGAEAGMRGAGLLAWEGLET
jgi:glucokinase